MRSHAPGRGSPGTKGAWQPGQGGVGGEGGGRACVRAASWSGATITSAACSRGMVGGLLAGSVISRVSPCSLPRWGPKMANWGSSAGAPLSASSSTTTTGPSSAGTALLRAESALEAVGMAVTTTGSTAITEPRSAPNWVRMVSNTAVRSSSPILNRGGRCCRCGVGRRCFGCCIGCCWREGEMWGWEWEEQGSVVRGVRGAGLGGAETRHGGWLPCAAGPDPSAAMTSNARPDFAAPGKLVQSAVAAPGVEVVVLLLVLVGVVVPASSERARVVRTRGPRHAPAPLHPGPWSAHARAQPTHL